MNVSVKNTFLVVEDEKVMAETLRRSQRRNKTLPAEWKQHSASSCCVSSDASTNYSPRGSLASSSEDECVGGSEDSCRIVSCPCAPPCIHAKTDAVTSAVSSFLSARLPGHQAKIEDSIVEQSRRVLICVEAQDGALSVSRCYELMQGVKQHLSCSVAYSEGLSLLSARVQKEDSGYSLRSSVACTPVDKADRMCWDVLRRGCCSRRKFCQWYHPQACDLVKFKIVIRCCRAKGKLSTA
eukprot:CAMPEP_0169126908 /NCGR_PEP_ID=MMETSP1015-20121227/35714_1 /TAXON_ID=342587 /ORGANISM="Karlodinium micrum, Strain CCMP2283" /LENGTH=238 /DNA_ID=CAMNT_0009190633 /DNA_START=45 /DNA_END=761 /DNA_ORIENTATION=+